MNNSLLQQIPASVLKAISLATIVIVVILCTPKQKQPFNYTIEEGKVWTYNTLVAEEDFPIYKSEEELQREEQTALLAYSPCFRQVGNNISLCIISPEDMQMVKDGGYDFIRLINRKHVSTDIIVDNLYTPKTAYEAVGRELEPTLAYDSLTSNQLRESILETVSPAEGAVLKGETIIQRGEIVSSETARILKSMQKAYAEKGISEQHLLFSRLSRYFIISFFIFLFAAYLVVFRRPLWNQLRSVVFFSIVAIILIAASLLLLQFPHPTLIYLIPFSWIVILVRVFYDSRTAFMLYLTCILTVSLYVGEPFVFLLLQIPVGLVTVVALKDITRRSQLALCAVYIFLAYSVIYTTFHIALTGTITHLSWKPYVCFAANGTLVLGVYGIIYVFEKLFGLVSSITLIELGNLNSDLMHEFAEKAPGTFQHSLQVSNLASEAAKSIGAKALLVRTGALYHDIGKMTQPEMFTENQADNHNPLLSLSNRDAAAIVISHVTEGVHIARKAGLPRVIEAFIRSHHGTSLVRYFYNSEVNRLRQENPEAEKDLNPADFQYPGPRPETKEEAILMMADAVEARSRSLTTYTEDSIRNMVEQMVGQQISDGQFALTPLSFRDLEDIKRTLADKLISIHHHRIQYPDIKPAHNAK